MRVARYARLSKKETKLAANDKQASIERQLRDAETFIGTLSGAVLSEHVYTEEGVSGARYGKKADGQSRRPAWDAMMTGAQAKQFDAVVMFSPDRGPRSKNLFEGGKAFADLHHCGVQIYFLDWGTEPLKLDTEMDFLMFTIRLFGAAAYRSSGQSKAASAKRSLAEAGFSVGIRVFGYKTVKQQDKHAVYVTDEPQAGLVKRAFTLADEGHGNLKIVQALGKPYEALTGRKLSKENVRRLLSNTAYIGELRVGTRKVQDTPDGGQKRVAVSENEWIRVKMPVIIDRALFDRVQAIKTTMRAHYVRTPKDGKLKLDGVKHML